MNALQKIFNEFNQKRINSNKDSYTISTWQKDSDKQLFLNIKELEKQIHIFYPMIIQDQNGNHLVLDFKHATEYSPNEYTLTKVPTIIKL